jgi:hypothetical protein
MERSEIVNANLFVMAAKALFGEHWINQTAAAFSVNERTVRRISSAATAEADGESRAATALLRPMLDRMRFERATLSKTIAYIEKHAQSSVMNAEFYAVLRFIDQDRLDMLAGYDGPLEACRSFGWVVGTSGSAILAELGQHAFQTEIADRERRGLDLDPDPLSPPRIEQAS